MPFGQPRRHFDECVSTNDLAREWAREPDAPAPHGASVTADFQTRGRGRRGKAWDAAPGESVLMSVILRPQCALSEAWQLGFVAALAAADALEDAGFAPQLKWPNDVLLEGGKVAGVLVETTPCGPAAWAAIAGIGINVHQSAFGPEGDYLHPPTSLFLQSGQQWPVPDITDALLSALERRTEQHAAEGFLPILHEWQTRLAVGAALRRGAQRAELLNLTCDGSAQVRLPDGTLALWATVES